MRFSFFASCMLSSFFLSSSVFAANLIIENEIDNLDVTATFVQSRYSNGNYIPPTGNKPPKIYLVRVNGGESKTTNINFSNGNNAIGLGIVAANIPGSKGIDVMGNLLQNRREFTCAIKKNFVSNSNYVIRIKRMDDGVVCAEEEGGVYRVVGVDPDLAVLNNVLSDENAGMADYSQTSGQNMCPSTSSLPKGFSCSMDTGFMVMPKGTFFDSSTDRIYMAPGKRCSDSSLFKYVNSSIMQKVTCVDQSSVSGVVGRGRCRSNVPVGSMCGYYTGYITVPVGTLFDGRSISLPLGYSCSSSDISSAVSRSRIVMECIDGTNSLGTAGAANNLVIGIGNSSSSSASGSGVMSVAQSNPYPGSSGGSAVSGSKGGSGSSSSSNSQSSSSSSGTSSSGSGPAPYSPPACPATIPAGFNCNEYTGGIPLPNAPGNYFDTEVGYILSSDYQCSRSDIQTMLNNLGYNCYNTPVSSSSGVPSNGAPVVSSPQTCPSLIPVGFICDSTTGGVGGIPVPNASGNLFDPYLGRYVLFSNYQCTRPDIKVMLNNSGYSCVNIVS